MIARDLAAQRAAELEADFSATVRKDSRCAPGPLAVRTGRAFVALGWRLGGTAALPPTVRRRLA